jgi:hypothetical protein
MQPKQKINKCVPSTETLFRKYYMRSDFPVAISFTGAQRNFKWLTGPKNIDLARFLHLFIEELIETQESFAFISEKDSIQYISSNSEKFIDVLLDLILPLKKALDSKNSVILVRAIKVLQGLLDLRPKIAEDLIP